MERLVFQQNNEPMTSSWLVAKKFGKRHDNVMQAIRNLKDGLLKFKDTPARFIESTYTHPQNGVTYPSGEYIEFHSLKDAAKALGVHARTIQQKIIGLKPSVKLVGFSFSLIKARRSTDRATYNRYGINETYNNDL